MATQTSLPASIPLVQPDWLEQRRKYVGGSDSASLFPEDSKYGCDVRLFFDKSGQKPDYPRTPKEENILKRGHIWESVVAMYFQEWASDKGSALRVRRMGMRVSKEHPNLAVNMDRQIINTTTAELQMLWPDSAEIAALAEREPFQCGPGYLECKSANEWMFKKLMQEGVPHDYILQVNHGLAVTGYQWGVFAVLEPSGGNFAAFPYVFRPNLAAEQIKRAEAFWATLEAGVMPEVKVNDQRCRTCLWRRSCPRSKQLLAERDKEFTAEGYVEDNSPELVTLLADYKEASEIADQKAETVDNIKAQIKTAVGERQRVEVASAGARISFAPTKPPMRWDSKALEGTVAALGRFDIPDEATCENVLKHQLPPSVAVEVECGQPAVAIYQCAPQPTALLYYMCEVCAVKAVKASGGRGLIVARKGVSEIVASCRRAGEPSRPLRIIYQ